MQGQKGVVRSVPLVVIFSIISCGIYFYYWVYMTSDELKRFTGNESINPTTDLLLCIFTCGIYTIYWFYKYSKIVYEAQVAAGLPNPSDNTVLNTVLAIFLLVASVAILQSSLNELWGHVEAN